MGVPHDEQDGEEGAREQPEEEEGVADDVVLPQLPHRAEEEGKPGVATAPAGVVERHHDESADEEAHGSPSEEAKVGSLEEAEDGLTDHGRHSEEDEGEEEEAGGGGGGQ